MTDGNASVPNFQTTRRCKKKLLYDGKMLIFYDGYVSNLSKRVDLLSGKQT